MLEHSNTSETLEIDTLMAAHLSHEKKSSEDLSELLGLLKQRVESHTELLSGLLSMQQHGFQLDSFAHVLDALYSQSEEISQYLTVLAVPVTVDGSH